MCLSSWSLIASLRRGKSCLFGVFNFDGGVDDVDVVIVIVVIILEKVSKGDVNFADDGLQS